MQRQFSKRIVFYRIGAIGDIVHTLPAIKLCKERNPQASVEIIIGSEQMRDLLLDSASYIDKIWVISHGDVLNKPLKSLFSSQTKTHPVFASIKDNPIDEFIYLHSNQIKAFMIGKYLLKAKKLFVYKTNLSYSAVANYALTYFSEEAEILKNKPLALLDYLSLKPSQAEYFNAPSKYYCIVLGVGKLRPSRAYPLSKWLDLIQKILQETDYFICILGGPDEKALSSEFESLLARDIDFSRIKNLIGQTSLKQLASILAGTLKVFSADTGILHIAAALGTEIEAVFTITSVKRFGPFSPKARVIQSANCRCAKEFGYKKKHCQYLVDNYAACAWDAGEFLVQLV